MSPWTLGQFRQKKGGPEGEIGLPANLKVEAQAGFTLKNVGVGGSMNPPGNEACYAAYIKSGHPMRKEAVKSEYSMIRSAEINIVNQLYINKMNFKNSIKNQYCDEKKRESEYSGCNLNSTTSQSGGLRQVV